MNDTTTDSPYIVAVDTREQRPMRFDRPIKIARGHFRRLLWTRATLRSGDYSIVGMTDRVTIERKSVADLYGTLGRGRKRFERELTRMQAMEWSAIVVEAELSTALSSPPPKSRMSPASVYQTSLAWMIRYPRTHWVWCPGRDAAEAAVSWLLERFWRTTQEADRCDTLIARAASSVTAQQVGAQNAATLT